MHQKLLFNLMTVGILITAPYHLGEECFLPPPPFEECHEKANTALVCAYKKLNTLMRTCAMEKDDCSGGGGGMEGCYSFPRILLKLSRVFFRWTHLKGFVQYGTRLLRPLGFSF